MKPELIRAVLDAARFYANEPGMHEGTPGRAMLSKAVRALEAEIAAGEPNKPTGFKVPRTWREIPAGWFVSTPDGKRFEVLATEADGAFQKVTLRLSPDKTGTWPRPANGEVWCQRGTHGRDLDDAIETLATAFGKVEVIEDALPPWDE